MVLALVLACACAAPSPRQINPAISTQLVSSEPPRAMGEPDPASVQTTSAELRSEQQREQKPTPAPRPRPAVRH